MSQIEKQVNTLVLGFFSKINANVTEKNGLFDVEIPDKYSKLFRTNNLKITFDDKILKLDNYELVSPGSHVLFKILNECIDFGPVITAKLNSNEFNSKIIRFYYYIIFESIRTKTKLIHVDVNIDTKKIVTINDSKIDFDDTSFDLQIQSEIVDDCYIESIKYLERISMKSEMNDFKNQMFQLKEEELQNITSEYKTHNKVIQEKYNILRSKGISGISLQKLIDENDTIRNEEVIVRKNLDEKYSILMDFALIGILILT